MQTPSGPPPDDRSPGASPDPGASPGPGAPPAPPWASAPPSAPPWEARPAAGPLGAPAAGPFDAPAAFTSPAPAPLAAAAPPAPSPAPVADPDALPPVAPLPGAGALAAPPALPAPTYVPPWAVGASVGPGEAAPRWIASSALPPGYQPESSTGQPDVLVFFRIYAGLLCLSGAGMTCNGIYEGVQQMGRGGVSLVMPVMYALFGTFTFGAYLLGVVAPRKPWMHIVGIIQIGLGILGSCCTWPIVVPLLIYWLKPEVKRWFDEGAERLIDR